MAGRSEQVTALNELAVVYASGLLRGAFTTIDQTPVLPLTDRLTDPTSLEIPPEAKALWDRANAEWEERYGRVLNARKTLLESGFPVPESWLLVDATGHPDLRWEANVDGVIGIVESSGPAGEPLKAVCDEIQAALLRLQHNPPHRREKKLQRETSQKGRGRKSTREEDRALAKEYSEKLNDGEVDGITDFARMKGLPRSTVSKKLKRGA